jgi:hypothetical protein
MPKRKLSSVLTDIRANVVPIALFQSILRPASKNEEAMPARIAEGFPDPICRIVKSARFGQSCHPKMRAFLWFFSPGRVFTFLRKYGTKVVGRVLASHGVV